MPKVRVPERTASVEELQEDRRRYLAAKADTSPITGQLEPTANMAHGLHLFAEWDRCPVCHRLMLFLGEADLCGPCIRLRKVMGELARLPRKAPSIHARVAIHLHALFGTVNDNGVHS